MRPVRCIPLVMLALCLISTTALAATEFGVIAGFNFANLRIENQSDLTGRSTFAIGGVADFGINDRFGIRVEPTFLSKGTKATQRNAYWSTMDGAVFDLDYIDVPILARYDLGEREVTHSYFLGGLGVSIATKQEAELTQGPETETVDMGDVLNPMDVSLDLGAGVSFPVGRNNRLTIDGRAAIGLININDGGTITFDGAPLAVPATSTHTLDFRLMATYLFPR